MERPGTGSTSPNSDLFHDVDASTRHALRKAMRKVDPDFARLVSDPVTEIRRHPAPFLTDHGIYRVEHRGPYRPIAFYVSLSASGSARLLTGAPENLTLLAREEALVVDSPEKAEALAYLYLEATRPMTERFYVVRSIDDVEFRAGLTSDDKDAEASFRNAYSSQIMPPHVDSEGDGYVVRVFAVRDQSLERLTLAIAPDAEMKRKVETLEENLPLVYGL